MCSFAYSGVCGVVYSDMCRGELWSVMRCCSVLCVALRCVWEYLECYEELCSVVCIVV